jgi:hypothetical protein
MRLTWADRLQIATISTLGSMLSIVLVWLLLSLFNVSAAMRLCLETSRTGVDAHICITR